MNEQSLILLKPDAVQRGLVGDILSRFEKVGLKIAAMKMLFATKGQLAEHYFKDDEWLISKGTMLIKNKGYPADHDPKKAGQEIVDGLVDDMMLSPIIALVMEGHNAVKVVKKLTGPTNIEEALPGTIRGDYSHDTYGLANTNNRPLITVIHCSGEVDEAKKEVKIWFTDAELYDYIKMDAVLHYRKGSQA